MIHYHGTPITPIAKFYELAGCNFVVSWANPSPAKDALSIGQQVLFDNGAFTNYTQKRNPDFPGYSTWLQELLTPPHLAIIPDVIGGTEEDQRLLLSDWVYPKEWSIWDFLLKTQPHTPYIHILRGLEQASKGPWPFASADSSNIAQNHHRFLSIQELVTRLDARNPRLVLKRKRFSKTGFLDA